VLDVALEKKIVQKAGSYFSFGDERLGQGRQNAAAFLAENPDVVQQILVRIQAEAPEEQVISARLLPSQAGAEEAVSEQAGSKPPMETDGAERPIRASRSQEAQLKEAEPAPVES
jgi:recombination protein RecA